MVDIVEQDQHPKPVIVVITLKVFVSFVACSDEDSMKMKVSLYFSPTADIEFPSWYLGERMEDLEGI